MPAFYFFKNINMEPHKQVFLKRYNLTPEKFDELKEKIDKECALKNGCTIKNIPECCSIFRGRVESLVLQI